MGWLGFMFFRGMDSILKSMLCLRCAITADVYEKETVHNIRYTTEKLTSKLLKQTVGS